MAVLADDRQITRVPIICNWQWQITSYSMSHTILNWQFYSNYLFLPVCDITEGEDDCVAQGRQNGLKKERFGVFRADNNPAKREVNRQAIQAYTIVLSSKLTMWPYDHFSPRLFYFPIDTSNGNANSWYPHPAAHSILQTLGWLEYHLLYGTVYYVHPTNKVMTVRCERMLAWC